MSGQNREAFWFTIKFSAAVGGSSVSCSARCSPTQRPPPRGREWLRNLVSSFSGVAANMGGIPLAFAFLTLLGRQGVLTKIINESFNTDIWTQRLLARHRRRA